MRLLRVTDKPVQTPPTQEITLTDAQMQELQQYADLHGITTDEAATQLAKARLKQRYVLPKGMPGIVIQFPRTPK